MSSNIVSRRTESLWVEEVTSARQHPRTPPLWEKSTREAQNCEIRVKPEGAGKAAWAFGGQFRRENRHPVVLPEGDMKAVLNPGWQVTLLGTIMRTVECLCNVPLSCQDPELHRNKKHDAFALKD